MLISKLFEPIIKISTDNSIEMRNLKSYYFDMTESFIEFVYFGNGLWNYREKSVIQMKKHYPYEDVLKEVYKKLNREYLDTNRQIYLLERRMDICLALFDTKDGFKKLEFRNEGDESGWGFDVDEIRSTDTSFEQIITIVEDIALYLWKNKTVKLRDRMIELYKGHYEHYNKIYAIQ